MTLEAQARLGGAAMTVPVAEGKVEVEMIGAGPPVIFAHGWTMDRRMWQPQVAALAQDFRVITYDRRGFGRSGAPPDLAQEPDDILAIANALEIDRFALVGMSQGGRVALSFAALHGGRLWGLAVQGAPLSDVTLPGLPVESASGENGVVSAAAAEAIPLAAMTALARAGELDAMRALWLQHPLMQARHAVERSVIEAMVHDYDARDLLGNGRSLDVVLADLTGIDAPTLIITGEHDTAWRHKVASAMERAILHARRVVIADGGHLCNLDQPAVFNSLLAAFLNDTNGRRAPMSIDQ